jgi:hypothetical protein
MRDSDTCMMILEGGEEIQAKKDILLLGEQRFGPPSEAITAPSPAAASTPLASSPASP